MTEPSAGSNASAPVPGNGSGPRLRRRWLLGILLAAASVLIAILGAAAWVLDSDRGLQTAARFLDAHSRGAIHVGAVDGRVLGGDFTLQDIRYADRDGAEIKLARLHLRWLPRELWVLRLHVERLDLDNLQIDLAASTPKKNTASEILPSRLPLDVVIDALKLDRLRLNQAGADSFAVDDAEFTGRWIGTHLQIDSLAATLPETGQLKLQAAAILASDQINISTLKLSGPGELTAQGRFGIGSVPSDLNLAFKDWRYPLTGDAPPQIAALEGSAQFSGPLDRYRYQLKANAIAQKQPITLAAHGSGTAQGLNLDALDLALGANAKGGSINTHGTLAWAPTLRADLQLALHQIDPAALSADWSGNINGTASTQTRLVDGQPQIGFMLAIDHSKLRGQPIMLSAQGSTDTRRVQLDHFTLAAGSGSLDGKGSAAWLPTLAVDADATLKQFNPGAFAPQWPGALNGSLHVQTKAQAAPQIAPSYTNTAPDIQADLALVNSRLRNYPLALIAKGDALMTAEVVVNLQQLHLVSGTTQLDASGRVTPPFEARGKLASPDLAALYPGLGGRLDVDFALQGLLDDPHLRSTGKGTALRERDTRFASLNWDIDVQPSKPSHVEITALDGYAGLAIPSLKLTATGTAAYHHVDFNGLTERGAVSLSLQGGYDRARNEWGGQWQSVRVAPQGLPVWSLEKPIGLLLGASRFSLEPACFVAAAAAGRACFTLEQKVTQPGLHLIWNLDNVALAAFKPLLPKDIDVRGRLDGQGELRWVDDNIAAAKGQLRLGDAHFAVPKTPVLDFQPSTLDFEQQPDGRLHASLSLQSAQAQLDADVSAAAGSSFPERALSGQVKLNVPDLGFIQPYVHELGAVGGHLDGNLSLAGNAGAPRLAGKLTLADGHAKLVTPGIQLTGINFDLTGNGQGPLALQGSMQSGGGTLEIRGSVDPAATPIRIDLSVKGTDFQAASVPDASVWISPDLHLLRDDSGARLEGTLIVPKANITPKDLGNGGVSVSADQVIVGAQAPPPEEAATPLKIYSNVKLMLGDAVSFKGFGLTTRIAGTVTVDEQPQHDPTARGELQLIDGAYKAYGQDLTIEDGRLIFDGGSVTQPTVDITASRHPADNIKVGVHVRGTLSKPQLSLQSEPQLTREQQLSWLLLGRSLDQSSSQDRSAISSAALSLGLSSGDFLVNRIGKSLGLDAISVGAAPAGGSDVSADPTAIVGSQAAQNAGNTSGNAAALTLGKYLTPKLFISYGVSLFEPGQTVRLLYTLNHGFKVQAESGVASGGDLLYTYERGK